MHPSTKNPNQNYSLGDISKILAAQIDYQMNAYLWLSAGFLGGWFICQYTGHCDREFTPVLLMLLSITVNLISRDLIASDIIVILNRLSSGNASGLQNCGIKLSMLVFTVSVILFFSALIVMIVTYTKNTCYYWLFFSFPIYYALYFLWLKCRIIITDKNLIDSRNG